MPMTARSAAVPTAKTTRAIYGALVSGMLLFALVGYFVLRRSFADAGYLPAAVVPLLLGVCLAACAAALLLRRRIPKRATDESADLFWAKASTPALLTWVPLEGASMFAVLLYALTGSSSAIGVAAVAIVLIVILNPRRLERT
ncbi:MAG TPA: hypothetical protein VJN70_18375 [Gemmatimonadaceae bacterium]|nr:hypothetical protein [Gemmatimonadaceae bacterium]